MVLAPLAIISFEAYLVALGLAIITCIGLGIYSLSSHRSLRGLAIAGIIIGSISLAAYILLLLILSL
ncbi:MAG: hypothetical protein EBZ77_15260 [Chitinophagia bacterium]|nr:hypothetical protein [Chitinophagia bacterium]